MRTLIAVFAACLFVTGLCCGAPLQRLQPVSAPTFKIAPIGQLKSTLSRKTPVKIGSAGSLVRYAPIGSGASSLVLNAAPVGLGAVENKQGNPAYKNGSGVVLTASSLRDPATGSAFQVNGVVYTDAPVSKSQKYPTGCLTVIFPVPAKQPSTFPMISGAFSQLPQSSHLYALNLSVAAIDGINHIRIRVGDQEFKGSQLTVNGDTYALVFTFNAGEYMVFGGTANHHGMLFVSAYWDGSGPAGLDVVLADFLAVQLAQLD